MTTYSKKLSRQIKKILGIEDAETFVTDISTKSKDKSNSTTNNISFIENLPEFFESIDTSYQQAEERVEMANRNIQISSNELNNVNRSLEQLNLSMQSMMDSLGQGFISFKQDGICSNTYSKACIKLLECEPAGKDISEVLKVSGDDLEALKDCINISFSSSHIIPFNELMEFAPKNFTHSKGLNIEIEYRPMYDIAGKLVSITMIATDKTDEQRIQEISQEYNETLEVITNVNKNRANFSETIHDLLTLTNDTLQNIDKHPIEDIKRNVHTMKGGSKIMGMHKIGELLHNLENDLDIANNSNTQSKVDKHIKQINQQLDEYLATIIELVGVDFINRDINRKVEIGEIFSYANKLKPKNKEAIKSKDSLIQALATQPISEAFKHFENDIDNIAKKVNKPLPKISFKDNKIKIIPENYSLFFKSIIHLANNIMDHGIEDTENRKLAKKTKAGHIKVISELSDNNLKISISDDGKGIDPNVIRERLYQLDNGTSSKKWDKVSDEDIIQEIFSANFSTQRNISIISGRGIGCNALMEAIKELKGSIKVISKLGKGTTFEIILPYLIDIPKVK